MQKKCKICIKNYEIIVDLKDTETAKKIIELGVEKVVDYLKKKKEK